MEQILLYIFYGMAGIALIVGGIWLALRKKKAPPPPPPPPRSPATPPTPPTPAPVASRSYGWVWWIIAILAAIIAYYVVLPALRNSTPAPKVAAPKKELRQCTKSFPLEFVGGEKLVREPGRVGIRKGGYANFRVNLPIVINGNYKIHYHGQRIKEGRDFLEINRGKGNSGNPFDIVHGATDLPIELIFFDSGYTIGMSGESKYFRSGENYFKLWADDDLLVQLDKQPYVEITYWE